MTAWIALAASLLCTIGAQLYFKAYHLRHRRALLWMALALFTAAVPCTMFAVRDLGVARVYVAAALTYVAAPLLAIRLFGERFGRLQVAGLAFIVAGVVVYNLA
ncbi:MAG: EamA family transporter [Lysobacterales bacterium]